DAAPPLDAGDATLTPLDPDTPELRLLCERLGVVGQPASFYAQMAPGLTASGYAWWLDEIPVEGGTSRLTYAFEAAGAHVARARFTDISGRVFEDECTLWVNPADAPRVRILSPRPGLDVLMGEDVEVRFEVTSPEEIIDVGLFVSDVRIAGGALADRLVIPSPLNREPGNLFYYLLATDARGQTGRSATQALILLNDAPYAAFSAYRHVREGDIFTVDYDARFTLDERPEALMYHWDFNNDGVWDTPWSASPLASYRFVVGTRDRLTRLEVRDHAGALAEVTSPIPSAPAMPVNAQGAMGLWRGGVIVNQPMTVPPGEILEIEAGAMVFFVPPEGAPPPVMLDVQGTLRVNGLLNAPVLFRGLNGDDWGSVRLGGPADTLLNTILLGGGPPLIVTNDSNLEWVISAHAQGPGLRFEEADQAQARWLWAWRARDVGVEVLGGAGLSLTDIYASDNGGAGVQIADGAEVNLLNGRLRGNGGAGLILEAGAGRLGVTNLRSVANHGAGFELAAPATLTDTRASENLGAGLALYHEEGVSLIQRASLAGNEGAGVRVEAPGRVQVQQSALMHNQGGGALFTPALERLNLPARPEGSLIQGCRFEANGWGAASALRLDSAEATVLDALSLDGPQTLEIHRASAPVLWAFEVVEDNTHLSNANVAQPEHPDAPKALAAGGRVSCALSHGGELSCWGEGPQALLEPPEGALGGGYIALAVGDEHGCALDVLGAPVCWGVDGVRLDAPNVSGLKGIDAQGQFTCAWGAGRDGLACWGGGALIPIAPPQGLLGPVAVGGGFICGHAPEGDALLCWGPNTPEGLARVALEVNVRGLSAGARHLCGIDEASDEAICWGESLAPPGQLERLAAGDGFTCGLSLEGALRCVGATPVGLEVDLPSPYRQISAGDDHLCAIDPHGKIACWGISRPTQVSDRWIEALAPGLTLTPAFGTVLRLEAGRARAEVLGAFDAQSLTALLPVGEAHLIFDGLSVGLDAQGNDWGAAGGVYDPLQRADISAPRTLYSQEVGPGAVPLD
ncbi:right-handed parallel beta-helix repeat-containing protein, partial [Myxococcota bacterium]|nr:right-handed parallel beta-helix repeat-containing protein [Myxococcota bacterium]MBU1900479.1 right-handed parallel beta-helix repeat-containing protein [Myxococcota bacterium]